MDIVDLAEAPDPVWEQAAALLVESFNHPRGWPTSTMAREEVSQVIGEGVARAAIERATLLGWVGGLPQYQGRVWELHPIVVRRGDRRRGIGRALVAAFESEAASRGALTITLGTDDDSDMTSLAGVNLYNDLPRHIADAHPIHQAEHRAVELSKETGNWPCTRLTRIFPQCDITPPMQAILNGIITNDKFR